MQKNNPEGDIDSPLLLSWWIGALADHQEIDETARRVFYRRAARVLPRQLEDKELLPQLFVSFVSHVQTQKQVLSVAEIAQSTNVVLGFCYDYRNRLLDKLYKEKLDNLPCNQELHQHLHQQQHVAQKTVATVTSETPRGVQAVADQWDVTGLSPPHLLRLLCWLPIQSRIAAAPIIGKMLTGDDTPKYDINPIRWYQEFAASQRIDEQKAWCRIMAANSIISEPLYRMASLPEQHRMRMEKLFPQSTQDPVELYYQHERILQQRLRVLLKWSMRTPANQQQLIDSLVSLPQHFYRIALGSVFRLPKSAYLPAVMIKHLLDEDRAKQLLQNIDWSDWQQRHFLLEPEVDAQVGRDAEIVLQALEQLEQYATVMGVHDA